jgi:hypothetical protein
LRDTVTTLLTPIVDRRAATALAFDIPEPAAVILV